MIQKPIKLAESTVDEDDLHALGGWLQRSPAPWLTQGPLVERFERAFAKHLGRHHAVFVNSGSSANLFAYQALAHLTAAGEHGGADLKVLAPAVAWATTVMPAVQLGWQVGLVDAESETWGMSASALETALKRATWSDRIKDRIGIVSLVHVLGVPADLDAIETLRKAYGFRLLEDCCAALGSTHHGRPVGRVGDVSTFSLYYGHQLSTIEGGMAVCDDDRIAELLRMTRAHGWAADLEPEARIRLKASTDLPAFNERFTFHVPGFNVRGTDLQAFLGLRQLDKAEEVYAARSDAYHRYRVRLEGSAYDLQHPAPESRAVPIGMGLLALDEAHRGRVAVALSADKIETRPIGGGNMARQPFWSRFVQASGRALSTDIGFADEVHFRGFQVPVHQGMSMDDVDRVCGVLLAVKP